MLHSLLSYCFYSYFWNEYSKCEKLVYFILPVTWRVIWNGFINTKDISFMKFDFTAVHS